MYRGRYFLNVPFWQSTKLKWSKTYSNKTIDTQINLTEPISWEIGIFKTNTTGQALTGGLHNNWIYLTHVNETAITDVYTAGKFIINLYGGL